MKRIHLGILMGLVMLAPAAKAQSKSSAPAGVEEELIKLDHKWLDSERTGDLDYCQKFFAESYVLVLADGTMYTKAEWLGILRGPDRPTLEVLDPTNIQVHVFGNVAILTDHTTGKGHDNKGTRLDGEFNVFRVVIKKNGSWQATGVVMNADKTKK
jgi:ketosteroid isomerase-like protein